VVTMEQHFEHLFADYAAVVARQGKARQVA